MELKLDVPFFEQTTPHNCGPVALQTILSYFGEDVSLERLEKEVDIQENKGIYTIQIGVAARVLGFSVEFYSKDEDSFELHQELEYYKEHSALSKNQVNAWVSRAIELGVRMHKKSLTEEELFSLVSKDSIPIVLLDWNIVRGTPEKGYQGHFLPITGYDEEYVYVHNNSLYEPQANQAIKRDVFLKAQKALGTDEDVVVIKRKA